MKRSEYVALIVFLCTAAAVYISAALAGFAYWRRKRAGRLTVLTKAVCYTLWAAAAVGLLCIADGFFIEPYRLVIERIHLTSSKVPQGQRIRILQVSDTHCEGWAGNEAKIPQIAKSLKPDLIVFTGDATNGPEGVARFSECMKALARIAPVYAVGGNWDNRWWLKNRHLFSDAGAHELLGEAVTLHLKNADVWLGGAPFGELYWTHELIPRAPTNAVTVFLYHSPDCIPSVAKEGADFCLVGHTHGGQVALPFYGAVITLTATGKRFESGLYHVNNTWAYVNRGVGMEGNHAPRVRFLCPPEVAVIDIVGRQ